MATNFEWTTPDGLKIFARDWSVDQPRAVIALVHGLGEHCERYNHLAKYFNDQGIAIVGYDRRGHGKSAGKRGHTPSYEAFLEEMDELLKQSKRLYPNVPLFMYGHSMGGTLALIHMLDRQADLAGVIVTGPAITLPKDPPALLLAFARLIRGIYPAFSQSSGLNAAHISRIEDEVRKYKNDPLVHDRITVETALSMLSEGERLAQYKGAVKVPLLMMHGGEDQITAAQGTTEFSRRVTGDIALKVWDGLYHEIHNENIREQVFDYALQWITQKLT